MRCAHLILSARAHAICLSMFICYVIQPKSQERNIKLLTKCLDDVTDDSIVFYFECKPSHVLIIEVDLEPSSKFNHFQIIIHVHR